MGLVFINGCDDKPISSHSDNNEKTVTYNPGIVQDVFESIINESLEHENKLKIAARELPLLKRQIDSIRINDLNGNYDYAIERFKYIESEKNMELISEVETFIYYLDDYELFIIQDRDLLQRVFPTKNIDENLRIVQNLLKKYKNLQERLISILGKERYKVTARISNRIYSERFCDVTEQFCIKDKINSSHMRKKLPTNVQIYVDPKTRHLIWAVESYGGLVPIEEYLDKATINRVSSKSSDVDMTQKSKYVDPNTGAIFSYPADNLIPLEEWDGKIKMWAPASNKPIDTDGDGLNDDWEIKYFGDISLYGTYDDPDNDGLPNLDEIIMGGDPTSWTNKTALIGS